MRKFFLSVLFFSSLISLLHFYDRASEGFSPKKICRKNLEKDISHKTSISKEILKILDQPYTYLARGGQVFAFESLDREYVIKFIRYDVFTPSIEEKFYFSFISKDPKPYDRSEKLQVAHNSYVLSHNLLCNQTNVLYSHLEKTNILEKKIKVIDKKGRSYLLDLDRLGFIIQRKVKLLGEVLLDLKDRNEREKIEQVLTSYIRVIKERSDKGIWIKDHNFPLRNYGLYEDNVYEIDVGSYRLGQDKNPRFFERNNLDHLKRFQLWLKEEFPEYVGYFHKQINKIIYEE